MKNYLLVIFLSLLSTFVFAWSYDIKLSNDLAAEVIRNDSNNYRVSIEFEMAKLNLEAIKISHGIIPLASNNPQCI